MRSVCFLTGRDVCFLSFVRLACAFLKVACLGQGPWLCVWQQMSDVLQFCCKSCAPGSVRSSRCCPSCPHPLQLLTGDAPGCRAGSNCSLGYPYLESHPWAKPHQCRLVLAGVPYPPGQTGAMASVGTEQPFPVVPATAGPARLQVI